MQRNYRVAYFSGGAADLISAHRSWKNKQHESTEVSVTFSSQIQDVCQELACSTLMISVKGPAAFLQDGLFDIEHRPKISAKGWRFHWQEFIYILGLLKSARKFKADIAFIDTGITHFLFASIFCVFGIKVVPILHNTLWPTGFYPKKRIHRIILALDRFFFWPLVPSALISVSPECERQVRQLHSTLRYRAYQIRAQFLSSYFHSILPATFPFVGTFNVLFIGRVERSKGVFDILRMAQHAEQLLPGRIRWKISGRGSDFDELQKELDSLNLKHVVDLLGWVSLETLHDIYDTTHCCIVPTRSSFAEGLAMTAVEAILAGRPLVSNPLVPATELLTDACLLGRVDDYLSHAEQVMQLASNSVLYERKRNFCANLGQDFFDPQKGLSVAVKDILKSIK
jgi:glycogen(starch) synthase